MFCKIINVFDLIFDRFDAFLLNKSVKKKILRTPKSDRCVFFNKPLEDV